MLIIYKPIYFFLHPDKNIKFLIGHELFVDITMKELYLLPSLISSIFLFSTAIYLLLRKPRKRYVLPLSLICWTVFLWNVGTVLTNITDGEIAWAKTSTLGLVFLPPVIFHFSVEYTKFFKDKYYLLAYAPAFLLAISLPLGYYVTGVEYRSYGFEPTYEFILFSINSWIGLFFVLFSTFILFKYYKENVGIKKRQTLYILFAIPANAFLSLISYEIMVEILHVAQFPVGAVLDFIMLGLIIYAILRFKLPVETAAEIDFRVLAETASDGICIIDEMGGIDYSNSYFCDMINIPNRKILGKALPYFVTDASREKANNVIKKTMHGEKILGLEVELKKEGDGTIAAEINTSPIIWNDKTIGGFVTIRNIEERKKAENALKESEERYRSIVEKSHAGITIIDNSFCTTYANNQMAKILGYSTNEIVGEDFRKFLDEESKKLAVDRYKKRQRGEDAPDRYEIRAVRKNGEKRDLEVSSAIIKDPMGNVRTIAQVLDITHRKKAEETLKESEEKYRTLVRNMSVGIYRNTPGERGKFIEANPAIIQMFGYESREDFLKLNVSDLYYYPTDRKKFNKKMLKDGFVKNEEIQLRRKDDSLMWGSVTAIAVKDEQGEVMYYDGIIEDITYRKKAAEEILKQKTYFQALFEGSAEAIVSLDEKHRVLEVNPAFVKLFGYSLDELKGKSLDDFVLPEEEDKIGRELTEKVVRGEIVKAEGQRKKKDGFLVYVSILGAPIFIEGKQVGIYTIYRDITARKEAEQEREFYDSLLRHDVANRNTIIQGSLELLEEEDLTEEQESIVKNALKAARSSGELIEMIRSLRRISGERDFISVKLHDTLSKVVDILDQQAKSKGIRIKYTRVKGVVKADQLIENIFSNIIQNAIIHSSCSTIIISGKEEEKGGEVVYKISIEDDGEGIPNDIKGNVFGLGVKSISSSGSGLGLYLVKKIVESYGGSVIITKPKQPKHGTIFSVYLPKFK